MIICPTTPKAAQPGFSLIEILVALMIVGAMIGLGITALQYLGKANKAKTETALQSVKLALGNFRTDTGSFPLSLQELIERPADNKLAAHWRGPYIEGGQVPLDGWGNEPMYTNNGPKNKPPYDLYSWGPEGEGSDPNTHVRLD
jgi:general secretion pathway protein G